MWTKSYPFCGLWRSKLFRQRAPVSFHILFQNDRRQLYQEREVRNRGQILHPLQGSPLTHLLSLPSHHAAFTGASGCAKNAKNPWNGPQSHCSKKICWVSTEQQWPAQHWPKAAALERHEIQVTKYLKKYRTKTSFSRRKTPTEKASAKTSHTSACWCLPPTSQVVSISSTVLSQHQVY